VFPLVNIGYTFVAMIKVKHLLRKAGLLYYSRRIPDDLKQHYPQSIIRTNLKTLDLSRAARLCSEYAAADDRRWQTLRSGLDEIALAQIIQLARGPKPIRLSDALTRYLAEHKRGKDIKFSRGVILAMDLVIRTIGDLGLKAITRDNARSVREVLTPGHSTATIRRRLNSINSVVNFGRKEFEVVCGNPFEGLAITGEGIDAKKRLPFSTDELRTIAVACRQMDDDVRWITGLQLGTGCRLAEVVGLRREDLFLNHEVPHISIRPYPALGRVLKTIASERLIPVLGIAAWGARQALDAPDGGSSWLFTRYARDNDIRANGASATINKWLSHKLGLPRTTHSFRHAMKDRLRDAGIARDLVEELMGHGSRSVADSYGVGFSLQRKAEALAKVALPI
jgi:integrase